MGCQGKTHAQFLEGLNRFKPFCRTGADGSPVRRDQVGIGPVMGSPDPAAQLIQLGQAEFVCPVNDDGVGAGYVDAGLYDRRTHQYIEPEVVKVQHYLLKLFFRHLSVRYPELGLRRQPGDFSCCFFYGAYLVMHKIYLSPPLDFPQHCFAEPDFIPFPDKDFYRQPF